LGSQDWRVAEGIEAAQREYHEKQAQLRERERAKLLKKLLELLWVLFALGIFFVPALGLIAAGTRHFPLPQHPIFLSLSTSLRHVPLTAILLRRGSGCWSD
jgi:hypothetical protein